MSLAEFPTDWQTALIVVAHPDDPEYGMAAAVAAWTATGKRVVYALASSGEVGIAGMPAAQAGPLREAEQRASAAVVGVSEVEFWGFPDSKITDSTELRATITEAITRIAPELVVSTFGGPEWSPGAPNQRDHMECAAAVLAAVDAVPSSDRPRWVFENGPHPTHAVAVDDEIDTAVRSLAEHKVYLAVLDPHTPVRLQAQHQIDQATAARTDFGGRRAACFELKRGG